MRGRKEIISKFSSLSCLCATATILFATQVCTPNAAFAEATALCSVNMGSQDRSEVEDGAHVFGPLSAKAFLITISSPEVLAAAAENAYKACSEKSKQKWLAEVADLNREYKASSMPCRAQLDGFNSAKRGSLSWDLENLPLIGGYGRKIISGTGDIDVEEVEKAVKADRENSDIFDDDRYQLRFSVLCSNTAKIVVKCYHSCELADPVTSGGTINGGDEETPVTGSPAVTGPGAIGVLDAGQVLTGSVGLGSEGHLILGTQVGE
jgi:hypothetical protein